MMEIKGKRILVTGGVGNIGSHIVDQLVKEKAGEVIVIDDFSRCRKENLEWASKNGSITLLTCDIRNPSLVNKSMENVDYVIHQAALRVTKCAEDPRLCNEVLVDGTFNVLEACVKNNVKKIVFASSALVYGEPSYLPMDENHPFNNRTAYGAAKIANEQMARAFKEMYGLKYIGLRPFNVYGPRMAISGPHTEVMIKWLDNLDNNNPPVIFGNGEQAMDFVYVEDVARANILALKSNVEEGIFNVGTGVMASLNQLAKVMIELTNQNLKITYKIPEKLTIVSKRQASTEKAKKELGFEAKTDLKTGLKKLIDWRREELSK